jgi:hypothetical protein
MAVAGVHTYLWLEVTVDNPILDLLMGFIGEG